MPASGADEPENAPHGRGVQAGLRAAGLRAVSQFDAVSGWFGLAMTGGQRRANLAGELVVRLADISYRISPEGSAGMGCMTGKEAEPIIQSMLAGTREYDRIGHFWEG